MVSDLFPGAGKCSLSVRQREELLQDTFSCHQQDTKRLLLMLDGRRCALRGFGRRMGTPEWEVKYLLVTWARFFSWQGLWWARPGGLPACWADGSVCAMDTAETGSGRWAPDRWGVLVGTELNWTQNPLQHVQERQGWGQGAALLWCWVTLEGDAGGWVPWEHSRECPRTLLGALLALLDSPDSSSHKLWMCQLSCS